MVEVVVLDEDEKVGKKMDKEVSGRLGETWVAVVVVGGQHRTLYNITAPKWVPIWGPGDLILWGPFFSFWVPKRSSFSFQGPNFPYFMLKNALKVRAAIVY